MRNALRNQERLCTVDQALAAILDRHPALSEIATARAALLKAREETLAALPAVSLLGPAPDSAAASARLSSGQPLLAPVLDALAAPAPELAARLFQAARVLIPAAARAFPMAAEALGRLGNFLDDAPAPGQFLAQALAASESQEALAALAAPYALEPGVLHLAAAESLMAVLTREAELLAPLVNQDAWRRSVCPVCGGGPDVGILKEGIEDSEFLIAKAGQLWLHCGQCGTMWRFPRLRCLACGCEDHQRLEVLEAEGDVRAAQERAHLCQECKTYSVTLNLVDRSDRVNLEMLALCVLPLELLAQEKGFAPVTATAWNRLG
jgi:FdhE protein